MADVAEKEIGINDYIDDYRDLEVSFDTLHMLENDTVSSNSSERLILPDDTYALKYKNDLNELVVSKTFTTTERHRYYCNPWALSKDLYGTTEFWFMLLDLNNMYTVAEFTLDTVKVYNGTLPLVISSILALEEDFINSNNEDLDEADNAIDTSTIDTSDIDEDENYVEEIETSSDDDDDDE